MSQYTPFSISRLIWLGPRAWLALLLIVGLLFGLSVPGFFRPPTAWVWRTAAEARAWPLRPSRIGRWVWRVQHVLRASGKTLLGRVGLLAGLLAASGLPTRCPWIWHWLWLPVIEWASGLALWAAPQGNLAPGVLVGRRLLQQAYQASVLGLGLLVFARGHPTPGLGLVAGTVITCERDGSRVDLERREDATGGPTYHVHLTGEFTYTLTPRDALEQRLLILDLRRLRTPGREASPWGLVTQEALAALCGVTQEEISRWQRYVREGQWAQLLSLADQALLTAEVRQQIVTVWAQNLWQTAATVRDHLATQGLTVTHRVVEEAGRQSGLMQIRTQLQAQWRQTAAGPHPRDGYVVQQLVHLVEQLLAQREASSSAIPEVVVEAAILRQRAEHTAPEQTPEKPWPWLFQIERDLFQDGPSGDGDPVHCPYCGTDHVGVKSRKPRRKVYRDLQGGWQTAEVYRYYCHNPACAYGSFTNLPAGVIAYSPWILDARLRALTLYAGLRTSYRGAASALGVTPATVYHWLTRLGTDLLPIAALFGMVRSSGIIGIDEKYVRVPKNSKPEGPSRQWMYVYVAVDAHTLDLLHLRLFPSLGKASAHTFLLELRAKGYRPTAIVTDLCADYAEPLAAVFPHAVHHECVFHALQYWHRGFKDAFGRDYAATHPDLERLRQQLDHVFQARTRRTVEKRYTALQAQWADAVQAEPRLGPIFESVVRHYPLLVNAYDHPQIPLTNNATERLIRRFDQHYQNFAGFDSFETAQRYLAVFELVYRLTPFGPEVQPHLRGKCPLELAGYDLTKVPLARYLRERGNTPLLPPPAEVVPK